MQVWERCQAFNHEIYEMFKDRFFFLARQSPFTDISHLSRVIGKAIAEQIFQAMFANKWIALDIEENITC